MESTSIRGRSTIDAQSAAITRVVALAPQRKLILEALDRVTASPAFHTSKRGREFFRYIVEHALAGELDQLKERCIGSTLFGRPADYDTGSDSVVRVTANEVRKRLAAYYAQTEPADPITFDLPTGGYIPEIHLDERHLRPVPALLPPAPEVLPTPRTRPRLLPLAGWAVALIFAALWLRTFVSATQSPQYRALQTLPWVSLFQGGSNPQLVMADSTMGTLHYFYPFPATVEYYANRRFLTPPDTLQQEFKSPWQGISRGKLTSVADARIASDFSPLAIAAGHTPIVRSAREYNLSDFRHGDNFILLGATSSNPWVELFQDQLDFTFVFNSGQPTRVDIRHPHQGDPSGLTTKVSSGATGDAYATLALVNGLDGRGRILIAQGNNMEGTDLAGALALNPDRLSTELKACGISPTNPQARFEILLRLRTTGGSAQTSSVLARRCK